MTILTCLKCGGEFEEPGAKPSAIYGVHTECLLDDILPEVDQ